MCMSIECQIQSICLKSCKIRFSLLHVSLLTLCLQIISCVGAGLHTNEFAVQIPDGEDAANEIASKYGFINKGQIGSLKGYYLFEHHAIEKRSLSPSLFHSEQLQNDPSVQWCEQQEVRKRVKRSTSNSFTGFKDPLYSEQWFLHGGGFGGNDMNVIPAWMEGYSGKGVVVSILDDGIQSNHPDLVQNYDARASWDINDADSDPNPQDDDDNKHGTRCAGEVAATANNEFCGVGIAYNSSIGGVRMLDGPVTDTIEATALSLNPDHIHIYSASWGPEDDGKTVDGPGKLARAAFEDGIFNGRSGLGSIFVWASGNGGRYSDNCNCDGYTNSIYTISVSSATQSGLMPWYLEQCSSTLATTYSSGASNRDQNIVTVDVSFSYQRKLQRNMNPDPSEVCTRSHTGTSASAPIAAAICALALEANPRLTWRDMQYITVLTSRYEPLSKEAGWITNGIGRKVSTKFGYGLMDAAAMVRLARGWKTLPEQHICINPPDTTERVIPSSYGSIVEATITTNGCSNTRNDVRYLEHVQVKISLFFVPRGNLHITLISPSDTQSEILLPRPRDKIEGYFRDWPFMSVHFWGESPHGTWKLMIANDGGLETMESGKLTNWSLIFYGTEKVPYERFSLRESEQDNSARRHTLVRGITELNEPYINKCAMLGEFEVAMDDEQTECRRKCPDGQYGSLKDFTCYMCDKSCSSCYGPSYNNCLSCSRHFLLKGTCVQSCPDGYFSEGVIPMNYCYPCLSSCSSCQSLDTCDSCKNGFVLYNHKCLSTCPEGTFRDQDVCGRCDRSCASCYGSQAHNCLSCLPPYVLHNNTCHQHCPQGYYANRDDYVCTKCHWSCDSCRDGDSCTSCKIDWELDSSEFCSYVGSNCRKGWNNPGIACEPCHTHCEQCSGPGAQDCVRCEQGYLWLEGQCVEKCPTDYYASQDECRGCDKHCTKCSNSECLACAKNLLYHKGRCLHSCPDGYFDDSKGKCEICHSDCTTCIGGSKQNCTSCSPNLYLNDKSCDKNCADGYYSSPSENKGECMSCYPTCKSCSEFGPLFCATCYSNSTFSEGACIPCLDGEFYNKRRKNCERCHPKCGRCYGPSENNCLSCFAPLRLDEVKHLCLPCCDGTQKKPDCCSCSADLDICVNSDHPRSILLNYPTEDYDEVVIPMRHVVPIVIAICSSVVLLYVLLFGILQANSMGWCRLKSRVQQYERVPSNSAVKFETEMEKISLTQGDLEEEDDIYEKV
ncbi:furin-like protease 2 isoform X2 [Parasteatoda tepidariorum]|uniref:furin-like protease 2 isoform X1 n=1 Tax=Parasteatoda tepidariorum TaxID=114398 RepID=UPI001C721C12|nr:furin isoform X1 [Parasteatoda tepidariorum]XP_042898987.1 furin isoform X2 [Parasteatoda tepidariorum]